MSDILDPEMGNQDENQSEEGGNQDPDGENAGNQQASEEVWDGVDTEYRGGIEKFKDVNGLAKSYVELEKKLGSQSEAPETDEEWGKTYDRLGRPEKASDYDLPPIVEGENPLTDRFADTGYGLGLSSKQAEGVYGWYLSELATAGKQADQSQEETVTALKTEWQGNFDKNIELASRAMQEAFPEDTVDKLRTAGVLNDKGFIMVMSKMGASKANDNLGSSQLNAETERTDSGLPMLNFPSMKE